MIFLRTQLGKPAAMEYKGISSDRRAAIGNAILEGAEHITREWERSSREEQPDADETKRGQLRNALPSFLHAFGDNLARGGHKLGRRHAIEHGAQRWEIGWSVSELVRDFMILRRCLLRYLRTEVDLAIEEGDAIAAMLDEAVADSVRAYSEHRESELVEKNEELKRSNYELRRFAHIVAHEIRSPLTTIQLAVRILLRSGKEDNSEDLQLIDDAASQMSAIVKDTLEYAKLGALDEPKEPVDLNTVLEDALAQIAYLVKNRRADIAAEALPTVDGHRCHLVQLFANLLENAIKYSKQTPRVSIGAHENDGALTLSFHDEGVGIPPEHHDSIFRFLTRAHQNPNVPGSGIGLAICRRVAEQHEGAIWVESEVGNGSTFFVRLPKS